MIYAYPRLSKTDLLGIRIGGNGLGNLLFTWARCLAASEQRGWQMVWPTWGSYKPKNKRANPYDIRVYKDLFDPPEGVIRGVRKLLVLTRYRWVSEYEPGEPDSSAVVQFRGMKDYFAPFMGKQNLVRQALIDMTQEQHLTGFLSGEESDYPVGIHIRRGDFTRAGDERKIGRADNIALPLSWYIAALEQIRDTWGADIKARVFSDGASEELAPLLNLPGVKRCEYGAGIADMLALSTSRFMVASGSTYSMWASFLGQMPSLWYPQKLLQKVIPGKPGYEFEWYPGQPLPRLNISALL